MNLRDKFAGESDDPVVVQALEHFKASVDASSRAAYSRLDAAHSRPRTTVVGSAGHSWRLAASWMLGCVLAAGSLAGAAYEHHHRQELARIAAAQAAAQKARQARLEAEKSVAANAVTKDQDLLATVDSDVSREIPAAMEPLAQLMDDNGNR
jgi:hypothetical protein